MEFGVRRMTRTDEQIVGRLQNQLQEVRRRAYDNIFEWAQIMARTANKECVVHNDTEGMVTQLEFYDKERPE